MLQSKNEYVLFIALLILLAIVMLFSICFGAVSISISEISNAFANLCNGTETASLNERIFIDIRLPRTIMSVLVGSTLAVGGILAQALFKNPIVEPGMIGTSSGASFGAALFIVLANTFSFATNNISLPVMASLGGMIGTFSVFALSKTNGGKNNSISLLLLIGVAVNALFLSGIGFLSYIARDPQARSITFWSLGTLSGSNWNAVAITTFTTVLGFIAAYFLGKDLNTLVLGNDEATYLGVNIKKLKLKVLLVNVIMVSIATSFVGVIGFIGLIAPHLTRIMVGSEIRKSLYFGAVLGAILLSTSDLAARILLSPAELPIGIVTSFIGVPVFILLLRKKNYFF